MIKGITFKEQGVSPEADGRIYAAIFNDGILHGCSISYAGYTLTLGTGYLVACGRLIRVSAAQNYACDGSAGGLARLVMTIDLSGISTDISFQQVTAAVEYAAEEGAFSALSQHDINDGIATVYQLEVARLSLSSNGISGILRTLPEVTFKEGST